MLISLLQFFLPSVPLALLFTFASFLSQHFYLSFYYSLVFSVSSVFDAINIFLFFLSFVSNFCLSFFITLFLQPFILRVWFFRCCKRCTRTFLLSSSQFLLFVFIFSSPSFLWPSRRRLCCDTHTFACSNTMCRCRSCAKRGAYFLRSSSVRDRFEIFSAHSSIARWLGHIHTHYFSNNEVFEESLNTGSSESCAQVQHKTFRYLKEQQQQTYQTTSLSR